MDRKTFLRNTLLGLTAVGVSPALSAEKNGPADGPRRQVGFEHLPPMPQERTMKHVLHLADTRGHADHGWLNSRHTFSFANYHHPERIHFGALRVLNDDIVAAGRGFGLHPHDNMEIISIPLAGDLEHRDSMGNVQVIRHHDVQIMSAGTGIQHSEFNKNPDAEVRFLQIWVFPKKRDIRPRYDQKTFLPEDRRNRLQVVVAPEGGDALAINQDAWFSLGRLDKGFETAYALHAPQNGVYAFVLEGSATVGGIALGRRDGLGMWDTDSISVRADADTELLLMEVPMTW
jgi:redox-sensitive bicupin YhaK (pirin superfamily)